MEWHPGIGMLTITGRAQGLPACALEISSSYHAVSTILFTTQEHLQRIRGEENVVTAASPLVLSPPLRV
jgi:hypothetical protein